jgi:hypothetical protein
MSDKQEVRNFGIGCIWGTVLSLPFFGLIYMLFRLMIKQ